MPRCQSMNQSAAPGGTRCTTTAEALSGEVVGSVGVAKYVVHAMRLSLGVSLDNNGAVLLRPGFTIRTH